jgi:dUTPase
MDSLKLSDNKPLKHIKEKTSIKLLLPEASFPTKEEGRTSSIGYGVELIQRCDNRAEDATHEINTYRTGISVIPPAGHYIEVIAQKHLYKHGYFLANSPIVIDPWNTGEIIIPLYKYKEIEDIELPFQAIQIVVKPAVYSHISTIRVTQDENFGVSSRENKFEYIQDSQIYQPPTNISRSQGQSRVKNHMF